MNAIYGLPLETIFSFLCKHELRIAGGAYQMWRRIARDVESTGPAPCALLHRPSSSVHYWEHSTRVCECAAASGSLFRLAWAREHGCPWDKNVCAQAAYYGHLELLQWARQRGCPWSQHALYMALQGGHFDVFCWLSDAGCPRATQGRFRPGGSACVCALAVNYGKEAVCWAYDHGHPWDERATEEAVNIGDFDMLKWLVKKGCPTDWSLMKAAAATGRVDILVWVFHKAENGSINIESDDPGDVPEDLFMDAVCGEHMNMLEWLCAINWPRDESACRGAAEDGQLEILRWLRSREPPFPWDESCCEAACDAKELQVLRWMRAQDPPCPWSDKTREGALAVGFAK